MLVFGRKKREHQQLEKQVEALHTERFQLEQSIARHRETTARSEQEYHVERAQRESEHIEATETNQQRLAEHRAELKSVRDHSSTVGSQCEASIAEAQLLATLGFEPDTPRLLVEVWVDKPSPRLLGEQWVLDSELCSTNVKQDLSLVPRLLCARPAGGKHAFGSPEHLAVLRNSLHLYFQVATSALEPPPAPTHTSSSKQFALSRLRVTSDMPLGGMGEQAKVAIGIWAWGSWSGVGSVASSSSSVRQLGYNALPPEVLTTPASQPRFPRCEQARAAKGAVSSWRLQVESVVGISDDELKRRPVEEHSIDFTLRPGSPSILGRQHRIIQALLGNRQDLVKSISRSHMKLNVAADDSGLIVTNLSQNVVTVSQKVVHRNGFAPLRNGETLSFMMPTTDETSPSSALPLAGAPCSPRTVVFSNSSLPQGQGMPQLGAFLTFRLLAMPSVPAHCPDGKVTFEKGSVNDANEDEEDDWDEQALEPQTPTCLVCASQGSCIGGAGELLYEVGDSNAASRAAIYCVACSAKLCAENPDLRVASVPRAVLPAHWVLLFQSSHVEVRRSQSSRTEWQATFDEQAIIPGLPSRDAAIAAADQMQRQRTARFTARRTDASTNLTRHAERHEVLANEEAELKSTELQHDVSSARRLQLDEKRTADLGSLKRDVEKFGYDAVSLRAELEMAAAAALLHRESETKSEAEMALKAKEESEVREHRAFEAKEEEAAAAKARSQPPPGPTVMIRGAAEPLHPPRGGTALENHRRLLQMMFEPEGLLYRDGRIEAHVVVGRHPGLRGESASPDEASEAPMHSLWAELIVQLRVRPKRSSPASSPGTSADGSDLAEGVGNDGFAAIQLHCETDVAALECELLPRSGADTSIGAVSKVVEQTIRFELLEFLAGHPTLNVNAHLSLGDDVQEHNCKVTLPIGITTFLRPLDTDTDFNEKWKGSGLTESHLGVPVPVPGSVRSASKSGRKKREPPPSPGLTPASVATGSEVVSAALTCGGAFRCFQLAGGVLGLGAELPEHGCVDEPHMVLVCVAPGSGVGVAAAKRGPGAKDIKGATWNIKARSPEKRLAEAVAAAIASQLKCLPEDSALGGPAASPTPSVLDARGSNDSHCNSRSLTPTTPY